MSKNDEYADDKYPKFAKMLTSEHSPWMVTLFHPYSTGLHCTNHHIDIARMQACDVRAKPQNRIVVFVPYSRIRFRMATMANFGNEKAQMRTALIMTLYFNAISKYSSGTSS